MFYFLITLTIISIVLAASMYYLLVQYDALWKRVSNIQRLALDLQDECDLLIADYRFRNPSERHELPEKADSNE